MSIFGNILSGIFGHAHAQQAQPAQAPKPAAAQQAPGERCAGPRFSAAPNDERRRASDAEGSATTATPVDVEPILDNLVSKKGEKLDWRHSIIDLMKALDLDSSLSARQELAKELHFSGNMNDSAAIDSGCTRR